MKRVQFLIALVLLLAALAGCAKLESVADAGRTPRATPESVSTRPPEATRASQGGVTILADGQLVAVNPVWPLNFSISGRLLTMTVKVGDSVGAGDLLAELETGELESRLAQAELSLQTAETTLAKAEQETADALIEARISLEKTRIRLEQAQAQNVDSPVTIAYIRLEQAQTALADAQEAYDRTWDSARDWELYMTDPTGMPPFEGPSMSKQLEQERESTERGLAMAHDNLAIVRADYSQVVSTRESHNYDLQALPQDLELAEFRVEQLERGADLLLVLNVEGARLEIESIEDQMKDAQLFAPSDGIILSADAAPGGLVGAGTPIITLFDPGELQFHTTNLSERDLAEIRPGQPVRVVLKTYPDDLLEGTVARIASQASGMVGDAAVFTVVIGLEATDLALRPGMTGRAEIATAD